MPIRIANATKTLPKKEINKNPLITSTIIDIIPIGAGPMRYPRPPQKSYPFLLALLK